MQNELKNLRLSLNMTQIEAAKLLNISRRTYQKYENSEVNDNKSDYLIYRLQKLTKVDETTGILTLDNIKDVINNILPKYDIKSCFLFGSYAKGYAKETSDVDLMIDSDITGLAYYGLIEELREGLHKKVDLLTLNSLSNNAEMLKEVLKDGIKIYEQYQKR